MSSIGQTPSEQRRLAALLRYDVLDTEPEEGFDRVTRLARKLLGMPIAALSFVDANREWFKSRPGLDVAEMPRQTALGEHGVRQDGPLIVGETHDDDRFALNPLVRGEPHIRSYAGVPLRTSEGCTIGMLAAMDVRPRDLGPDEVAALADLGRIVMGELELRRLAVGDELTGALSRQAFLAEARRDFSLARRHRQELSCIVLDVDRLQLANESFGRAACDAAITAIVELCRRGLRSSDYIGRPSGDAFAIMLPQTSVRSAVYVAERLRKAIERHALDAPAGSPKLTASFGIAPCDASVADVGALLRRADVALYGAKSGGRNRCVNFATQHLRSIDRVA